MRPLKTLACPICSLSFSKEPTLSLHLKTTHNIIDEEMLYIEHFCSGVKPVCQCSSNCQKNISWKGWRKGYTSKYIKGHNARVSSTFTSSEMQTMMADKRKKGYSAGAYSVWNKGLTKETDERVKSMSLKISSTINEGYSSGRIADWRQLHPERAKEMVRKTTATRKRLFSAGEISIWNKGLTKENNETLLRTSRKISANYSNREAGRRISRKKLQERLEKIVGFTLITPVEEYRNKHTQRLSFKHDVCERIVVKTLGLMEAYPVCYHCHPKSSVEQLEIFEFVKSLGFEPKLSDKRLIAPKEIDVLVDGVLAIEYDGLFWHSEMIVPDTHASEKLRLCIDAGVELLRIYQDEWMYKRSIVEAHIKRRLNVEMKYIQSCDCVIKVINDNERALFNNTNHIEGDVAADVSYGLEHAGLLVATISFNVQCDVFCIIQFCELIDTVVVDALKTFLSYVQHAHVIDTFVVSVDRRLISTKMYEDVGFIITSETCKKEWLTDFDKRYDVNVSNKCVRLVGSPMTNLILTPITLQ